MRGEKILAPPRWATIRCLTLSPTRKDSTSRRYSCWPLAVLTERRNKRHYMTLHIHEYMDHFRGIFCDSRFSCGTTFCSDSPDRSCVFNGLGGTDPSRRANMRYSSPTSALLRTRRS